MKDKPESPRHAKHSREHVTHVLGEHHAAMAHAVGRVLADAGLPELAVQSIRFAMPAGFPSHCDPACTDGQRCVPESDGAEVRWVCVPR